MGKALVQSPTSRIDVWYPDQRSISDGLRRNRFLEGLLIAGATNIALNPALTGIISLLIAFFIGICGREWWGAALERRGFELAGIVQGGTPEDAERRFYDHYRSARPRNLVVQPFSTSMSQSTREPGVIGLFPDIRGFR